MKPFWEVVATVVVVGCAVLMTAVFLYDRSIAASSSPIEIPEWEAHNETGIRLGPPDAKVVITEFMDFACPFSQRFAAVTDSLRSTFPDRVAVVFQHFPLGREGSMPLAMAAECAAEQDRFEPMYKVLFGSERPEPEFSDEWVLYAERAGLPDLTEFMACISRPADSFERISAGRRIGEAAGVPGTPTVWVNGRPTDARSVEALKVFAEEMGLGLAN